MVLSLLNYRLEYDIPIYLNLDLMAVYVLKVELILASLFFGASFSFSHIPFLVPLYHKM